MQQETPAGDHPETTAEPVLGGRYRLEGLIGRGGMADVHRGTDQLLHRPVAVKVLRDTTAEESARERFVAEARTLAALSHRNLVMVLDAGITGDHPFLVMELVDGETLADCCSGRALEADRVAEIGGQLAEALAYAHGQGVVHRDVKPANVLLGDDGRVRLADFGIARLLGDTVRHTRTGQAIGTAAYLAPEQVRGAEVTTSVDVWSLGLVLLEALTGRREYPGPAVEAAMARLHRVPDVPADLPAPWPDLLRRMTDPDPARRPAAEEVAAVLRGAAGRAASEPVPTQATRVLTARHPVPPPPSAAADAAPATPAPGFADRAGDAIAARTRRALAALRRMPAHQRGVAGALAAIVLLLVVAAFAAEERTDPADDDRERQRPPGQRSNR
ncbi:serine/threonine-protein kinase [Nocardioides ferulae]|uniref:serine/threonine-protein kinase n=1 Tax=Nocardioides ferulae TaxID=2340821 RepID=UPI000EAEC7EC|nr:serine/threonine-protein kinase [Nocardioides ferulae]